MERKKLVGLSRNHKARISVSMQVLEDTIYEVEGIIIRDANIRKVMTETIDDLSSLERALILRCIEEIKNLINQVAQKLGLDKQREEMRSRLVGVMTIQWVNLEEIRSKRLRGYGEVPDELRDFLDPQVDKMIRLVDKICGIASPKDKEAKRQGEKT